MQFIVPGERHKNGCPTVTDGIAHVSQLSTERTVLPRRASCADSLQRDGYRRWLRRERRVTAPGEVLAGELRRRSGSLFASVGMLWATNALGVLWGVVAWRLAA